MTTVATPPDADGWCSLSLHAGGTVAELSRAGADPQRLLIVEVSDSVHNVLLLVPSYALTAGIGALFGTVV